MQGYFFRLPWVWESGAAGTFLFFFALSLAFFVLGFWFATVYRRFGSLALTVLLVGIGALLVVGLFFVGRADAWAEVFGSLARLGAVGSALSGLVIAVLAGISFLTLRRATP